MTFQLKTERLVLREWREDDRSPFFDELNNDPDVMQHMGGILSREDSDAGVDRTILCQAENGHCFWAIERIKDGRFLGFCGLKRVNDTTAPDTGSAEVGWRLSKQAWGKGYAKESAIASLDFAFGPLKEPFVSAFTIPSNKPSWGLMERLGMSRRKDLDFFDPKWGPLVGPEIVYRITAEEWAEHRKELLK